MILFEAPIRKGKVRKDVFYRQFLNGCIVIDNERYFFYSLKQAVKKWRNDHPLKSFT